MGSKQQPRAGHGQTEDQLSRCWRNCGVVGRGREKQTSSDQQVRGGENKLQRITSLDGAEGRGRSKPKRDGWTLPEAQRQQSSPHSRGLMGCKYRSLSANSGHRNNK